MWGVRCLGLDGSVIFEGPFASKSNRRTAAPTFDRIPSGGIRFNVGAAVRRFDLLAKASDQAKMITGQTPAP